MKKIVSLILSLALILSCCSFAMAAGSPSSPTPWWETEPANDDICTIELGAPTEEWAVALAESIMAGERTDLTGDFDVAEIYGLNVNSLKNYGKNPYSWTVEMPTAFTADQEVRFLFVAQSGESWDLESEVNADGTVTVLIPRVCLKAIANGSGLLVVLVKGLEA